MKGPAGLLAVTALFACPGCESTPVRVAPALETLDLRRCKPGPGTTGSPQSIEEAVALANALPFPVTAECFVEALDRPLGIEATFSHNSVQPAQGERSPRVFLWTDDALVIAIVLEGEGRNLIEFGQFVGPNRSIKAELEFPLTHPATQADPHDRVRNERHPSITTCFVCHDDEQDEPSVPGGRSSLALRPHPLSLVTVSALSTEHQACDWTKEPDRCGYLQALMGHGPVEHRAFAETLPVF